MKNRYIFVLLLILLSPMSLFAWKMESASVTLPSTVGGNVGWTTVTLQQNYTDPLVFVMPTEENGYPQSDPTSLRVKNVTSNTFDIVQLAGTKSSDTNSTHPEMTIKYFVIDKGEYTLNGVKIVAGDINTMEIQHGNNISGTEGYDTVTYSTPFSNTPVLLAMIQTVDNQPGLDPDTISSPWLSTALNNSANDSFEVALDRLEVDRGSVSTTERVAYLAIDAGALDTFRDISCQEIDMETILTQRSIKGWDDNGGCFDQAYSGTYAVAPNVIGTQNTHNGGDGGWLRRCSPSTTAGIGLIIDEDLYVDNRKHGAAESAGLLIFSQDFVFDSAFNPGACIVQPVLDYRMDECSWFDSASGVSKDVKDSSSNAFDATSSGAAALTTNVANVPQCNYGTFVAQPDLVAVEDATAGNTGGGLTVSVWLKPSAMTNWQAIVTKSKAYDWDDGWGFVHYSGDANNEIRFFVNQYDNSYTAQLTLDIWNHVVATYDKQKIRIYVNGVEFGTGLNYTSTVVNSGVTDPMRIAYDDPGDDEYIGGVDEVKFWDQALTTKDIEVMYNNESNSLNFDGTVRTCNTCKASMAANTWEMISIPADLRSNNYSVASVLSDDIGGTYGTDWIVFDRNYSDTNNSSWYTALAESTVLKFGEGYFFSSKNNGTWDVNDIPAVDYNATNSDCPANRCVEVDLKAVSLDGATDDLVGTGSYRNYLTSFPGKAPVNWADCRFILDGTAYTPSAADANGTGFASKQIWQYNPGAGANSNGYTTCDDVTPGGCKLEPYKAFWVQLRGATKGTSVKLLIPQE